MNSIKNALTRKFGPLPAWAWFLIGGGALIWYRQHTSGAAASTADQAQQATTGWYGPYGQDNYPINGGTGMGGGSSGGDNGSGGASTGSTEPSTAPTIIVNPPSATEALTPGTRTVKPKAGHGVRKPVRKPTHKAPARSAAAVHNGRQHPHASGQPRTSAPRARAAGGGGGNVTLGQSSPPKPQPTARWGSSRGWTQAKAPKPHKAAKPKKGKK